MDLKQWREKLLDLGRGNRLLNFKDSKMGTLEINYPDLFKIFEFASCNYEFINTDKLRKKFPGVTTEELFQTITLKDKQLFADKNGEFIKTIKQISKKTSEYFEEKGINALYLALGFLEWKDSIGEYEAPILLIPARIKNEDASGKYLLDLDEDEIVLNPTLKYKLNLDSCINLKDYEEPIADYLAYVQEKVSPLEWKVNHKVFLGMFSFMKINMYMDLKDNEKKILENANVNLLLGNSYSADLQKEIPLTLHNVVDADSSQMEAIRKIKSGKSLVLQGPPGTGKSQTITNIIAEALMDDKKVLFVSEKLAALKVVYNKLKKVGLEDYCLELHSQKTNKKEVINALYDSLMKKKQKLTNNAYEEIEELQRNKEKLDEYDIALHKNNPIIEKSVYEIYGKLSKYRNINMIDFSIKKIEEKGVNHLKKADELLQKYISGINVTGYDYKTFTWYGFINKDNSYANQMSIKETMNSCVKYLDELNDFKEEIYQTYQLLVTDANKTYALKTLFETLYDMTFYHESLFDEFKLKDIIRVLLDLEGLASKAKAYRNDISKVFDDGIYKVDWEAVYRRYKKEYAHKFLLFNGKYKADRKQLALFQFNSKKIKFNEMLKHVEDIFAYQELIREIDKKSKDISACLGSAYNNYETDFKTIIHQLDALLRINKTLDIKNLRKITLDKNKIKKDLDILDYILARHEAKYVELSKSIDSKIIDLDNLEFLVIKKKINAMLREFDGLNAWISFLNIFNELKENDLVTYLDEVISLSMKPELIIPTYHKVYYNHWLYHLLGEDKILSNFNRITQDMYVDNFSLKDNLQFSISKWQIVAKLSGNIPDLDVVTPKSPAATIKREYQKKRKQMPVRMLLQTMPDFIQTLKPCFLMSPLSVSTYLDNVTFDLVVFDEASQIFPEDAIGAIYRAKQAVVVGDTKQMPPSNFFKSASNDESDSYEESINDYESILDICATCFSEHCLKWHYRSKTESLIGYSNEHFYGGQLVSFPSTIKDKEDFGVEFIYTKDGTFNRNTKSNKIEAQKTAELVIEHYKKYQNTKSLGVVAFSITQQEEIENALDKLKQKNKDLEEYFNNSEEPFFIKNLETVQGDERDSIFLSVGYAKDESGKFYHNFGPLNQVGGERRLNVAITRAKENVKVIASIRHTDIDLDRTSSLGAELLKTYLYYAENNSKVALKISAINNTTDFEKEVAEFIKSRGYDVEMNVGYSQDKIDIAVKYPDKEEYAIAIECDGNTYRNSKSTRDRDRLRREVLERCGWTYYRLWSTEWYKNNRYEKERLIQAIDKSFSGKVERKKPLENVEFVSKDDYEEYGVFTPAHDQEIINQFKNKTNKFKDLLYKFLNSEAPLCEEYLLKRIVSIFKKKTADGKAVSRATVTNTVREEYKKEISKIESGIIFRNGFIYLDEQKLYKLRLYEDKAKTRDIKYIAKEELAGGMIEIIKANKSVDREGLYQLICELLGGARLIESNRIKLDEAVNYLVELGYVSVDGNTIKVG